MSEHGGARSAAITVTPVLVRRSGKRMLLFHAPATAVVLTPEQARDIAQNLLWAAGFAEAATAAEFEAGRALAARVPEGSA